MFTRVPRPGKTAANEPKHLLKGGRAVRSRRARTPAPVHLLEAEAVGPTRHRGQPASLRLIRFVASALLVGGTAGSILGALGIGVTAASASTTPVDYNCAVPVVGNEPLSVSITTDAPASVSPGATVTLTDVQATVTIPGSLTTLLAALGTSFSGTVPTFDIASSNTAATGNATTTPAPFDITITAGDPASLTVPATATSLGGFTAGTSGSLDFSAGEIDIDLTAPLVVTITCVPATGQPDLVDVPIITPSTTTVPVTTSTVPATTTTVPVTTSTVPATTTTTVPSTTTTAPTTTTVPATTTTLTSTTSTTTGGTTTTTSGTGSGSGPPSTVPPTHTGEPWAGWPYWLVVAVLGALGLLATVRATRIRRGKA
jgi:hypothetical protein